jgi:hypothetical protein
LRRGRCRRGGRCTTMCPPHMAHAPRPPHLQALQPWGTAPRRDECTGPCLQIHTQVGSVQGWWCVGGWGVGGGCVSKVGPRDWPRQPPQTGSLRPLPRSRHARDPITSPDPGSALQVQGKCRFGGLAGWGTRDRGGWRGWRSHWLACPVDRFGVPDAEQTTHPHTTCTQRWPCTRGRPSHHPGARHPAGPRPCWHIARVARTCRCPHTTPSPPRRSGRLRRQLGTPPPTPSDTLRTPRTT